MASARSPATATTIWLRARERLHSKDGIAYVRKRIAEELRDYSRNLEADIKTHRERIERTENRVKGLVGFIADGDRSDAVVSALRDLEAQAKSDRAAVERLRHEAQEPLRLPSLDEIGALVTDLLDNDRARLRRWHRDGEIRIVRTAEGIFAKGTLLPCSILLDPGPEKRKRPDYQEDSQALSNVRSGGSLFSSIYRLSRRNSGTASALRTLIAC